MKIRLSHCEGWKTPTWLPNHCSMKACAVVTRCNFRNNGRVTKFSLQIFFFFFFIYHFCQVHLHAQLGGQKSWVLIFSLKESFSEVLNRNIVMQNMQLLKRTKTLFLNEYSNHLAAVICFLVYFWGRTSDSAVLQKNRVTPTQKSLWVYNILLRKRCKFKHACTTRLTKPSLPLRSDVLLSEKMLIACSSVLKENFTVAIP